MSKEELIDVHGKPIKIGHILRYVGPKGGEPAGIYFTVEDYNGKPDIRDGNNNCGTCVTGLNGDVETLGHWSENLDLVDNSYGYESPVVDELSLKEDFQIDVMDVVKWAVKARRVIPWLLDEAMKRELHLLDCEEVRQARELIRQDAIFKIRD